MQTTGDNGAASPTPIDAARVAIWRLFQEGYVDEDMATASLLAVDLGARRRRQQGGAPRSQAAITSARMVA